MHFRPSCLCVDIFHVDLRDSVEQHVRRKCLMHRVDLVQLDGQVPHPKDDVDARQATCDRTDLPLCQTERSGEQDLKSLGDPPLWRWSSRTRNHNLFWRMLQIWLGTSIVVEEDCF